jgi:alkylation response protein AidB-like acyl-CoA dehydrogenase
MTDSGTELLESLRALAPTLTARSQEIEEARRLPADLLMALTHAGVFRMFVPRSFGGLAVDLRSGLEVLELLARADGAVGWTAMIGAEAPQLFSLLDRDRFAELYVLGPDVILGGGFNPQGVARPVTGGHRVTGRWAFVSGSEHCHWLFGTCLLLDEHGQPQQGPTGPRTRSMLFRADQARILDTWRVLGLRGTGSQDISVEDLLVPESDSFDLFGGSPSVEQQAYAAPILQFALHMGAVAVGIAQGAVDDVLALARSGKKRLYAVTPLGENPHFHHQLGEAEVAVRAARALLHAEAARFSQLCLEAPERAPAMTPQVTSALVCVVRTATGALDLLFRAAGGSVARDGAPLQRRFRDLHTLAQHGACTDGWYAGAGAALLDNPAPAR